MVRKPAVGGQRGRSPLGSVDFVPGPQPPGCCRQSGVECGVVHLGRHRSCGQRRRGKPRPLLLTTLEGREKGGGTSQAGKSIGLGWTDADGRERGGERR